MLEIKQCKINMFQTITKAAIIEQKTVAIGLRLLAAACSRSTYDCKLFVKMDWNFWNVKKIIYLHQNNFG